MSIIKFKVRKSSLKDDSGDNYYMVKAATEKYSVDSKALASDLIRNTTVTQGDFDAVTSGIKELVKQKLLDNKRVEIPGIGTLQLSVGLFGKSKVTDPKNITANDVIITGVQFNLSSKLKKELLSEARTYKKDDVFVSNVLSEEEIKQKLDKFAVDNLYITTRYAMSLFGVTRQKAREILNSLCDGEHPMLTANRNGNLIVYLFNAH
jgi:predicted histone-like DNA-binding protein